VEEQHGCATAPQPEQRPAWQVPAVDPQAVVSLRHRLL
jgi:hypothetical protein